MPTTSSSSSASAAPSRSLPDDRCCYCLKLRSGAALIALIHLLFAVVYFAWFLSGFISGDGVTTVFDIIFFIIFGSEFVSNILLLVASIRKSPNLTWPWLCVNGVAWLIYLIIILYLILSGALNTPWSLIGGFALSLALLAIRAAILFFSLIVVYHFKNHTIEVRSIRGHYRPSAPTPEEGQNSDRPHSPPPSYEETTKVRPSFDQSRPNENYSNKGYKAVDVGDEAHRRPRLDEQPPDYDAAVAMTSEVDKQLMRTCLSPPL